MRHNMRLVFFILMASALLPSVGRAQAPVFAIAQQGSSIKFHVQSSVGIDGTFDKSTGTLDIQIQSASVDTGSGLKNGKLKGEDFFAVKQNPVISFRSKKIAQTGPDTFEVQGDFTIRGVSKPETLTLKVSGKGTGSGDIHGTMAFDRRDYGMNSGIPFIRVADRVEVTVHIKGKRISGPPLVFKQ
jgi:polyisoprenoid-binding protein YceI